MSITPEQIKEVQAKATLLYGQAQVEAALDQMAKEITEQLAETNPIFITVMTGAVVVMGQLLTRLPFPLVTDYAHATRYRSTTRGGDLHWLVEPRTNLTDRTVVVVDDVLDGGLTFAAVVDYCKQLGAKAVYTAVLVDKIREREEGAIEKADFTGIECENKYIYGYGLDYHEYLRNVSGIYAVADEHM